MLTRVDELIALRIELLEGSVHVMVRSTITDSNDGSTVAETYMVTDGIAAFNAGITQSYITTGLAYANQVKAAGAPAITLAAPNPT